MPEEELEVEFGWISAQMPLFVVMGVGKKSGAGVHQAGCVDEDKGQLSPGLRER